MLKKFNIFEELPKSMYVLFFVQVVNRFGDFVIPFLTLYLTEKLGLSVEITGIIVTISSLSTIPGSLAGGKFADKIGRKKTYIISQTTAALSLIPCAFTSNPWVTVVFILISTFFNGAVRPPMTAIIVDILPPNKRKLGFSLQYLGTNLGVSLGLIVAGFLFNNCLPLLFLGDAITSFIAVALVIMYIKETNPSHMKENITHKEKKETGNIYEALLKRPEVLIFLLVYVIYSTVYTQCKFSLPLTLDKIFLNKGAEKFGLLMSINAFTVIILSMWITNITRKLHTLINIIIAGVLYAVGFGIIGMIHSFPMFVISTILWTIGEILVSTNFGAYLANNSPANFRARFSAIGSLSWAIGAALGTSAMGKYINLMGINMVWPFTFVLSFISTILMFVLYLHSTRKIKTTQKETI